MEITVFVISGVIVALTEVVKRVFALSDEASQRYLPAVNLLFGVILGGVFLQTGDIKMNLLFGLLAGLGAGGLYDLTPIKKVVNSIGGQ